MSASCKCQHHLLCNSVPFSLWTVFTNRVPLISDPGPRNDQSLAGNLFANIDTRSALGLHLGSLSPDPHKISLNIDMKIIRPLNCDGSLILTGTHGLCWW